MKHGDARPNRTAPLRWAAALAVALGISLPQVAQAGRVTPPVVPKGGLAPATGCLVPTDVGNQAFVPYTADYFSYFSAEDEVNPDGDRPSASSRVSQ